jgi:3-methylfumaryl-CoA hydratase
MTGSDASYPKSFIGRVQSSEDIVSVTILERLAATLDMPVPTDRVLPALWHWLLFQEWMGTTELARDGHPKRGGFLPDDHNFSRRMWGGGRVVFHKNLSIGESVSRMSTILGIEEKVGSSGRFMIVTVRHEIMGSEGLAISEEQDIIYRNTEQLRTTPREQPAHPSPDSFARQVTPSAVLLFRYSALTGNAHRIHYDREYACGEEGYPGLVVQGPLQATWLADLVLRQRIGSIVRFSYRAQRVAVAHKALRLEGWRESTRVRLQTRDAAGAICMSAEAILA